MLDLLNSKIGIRHIYILPSTYPHISDISYLSLVYVVTKAFCTQMHAPTDIELHGCISSGDCSLPITG